VKKLFSPIRTLCVAACAVLAVEGTPHAQSVTQAKVSDLLAQAKTQTQTMPPAQTGAVTPNAPGLELTMDEAVAKALQLNIDLSVARLNPELQDWALAQAFGVYAPTLSSTIGEQSLTRAPGSQIGGGAKVKTKTTTYNFGATQALKWTGATASVNWTNSRQGTDNNLTTLNPRFDAGLQASITQPLVRNRSIDANRQALVTAEINRRIADISLRATTINTVANTKDAYWDLVYNIQAVEAAKTSLALAQKLVEDNKIRVEIGTLAPLDIVSAQAEAATRQQTLVTAQGNLQTSELALKRMIVNGTSDPLWNARLNPVDRPPTNVEEKIDLEAALRTALENRTDMVIARRNLEISDIGLRYQHNQTLPGVDLIGSYQTAGTGGVQLNLPPLPSVYGGYADALSQLAKLQLPTWSVQVQVSYPIGTSVQDATYARSKVQYQQALAQLKALELSVATDVTNQALTVQSAFQQVQAAAAARDLSQKRLEAEQSKFEVGMSTNYDVVLAQRDFTDAQNSELRAILNYRKAIVDFQRKQETASSGGSNGISTGGSISPGSTGGIISSGSTGGIISSGSTGGQ
jgi:outer membrane protein